MTVSLLDIGPNQCRWPVNPPAPSRRRPVAPGPYFCGAATSGGTSYCAAHRHRIYQPGTALPPRPPKCDRTSAAAPREERERDLVEVLG